MVDDDVVGLDGDRRMAVIGAAERQGDHQIVGVVVVDAETVDFVHNEAAVADDLCR